jgi:CIC family chloride channel protein
MWSVALVEQCFQRMRIINAFCRPMIGGAILGLLALLTPAVLGAGHGAMQIMLVTNPTWLLILTIISLKILASAVSLGSGFRGGLFFASLLLGTLFGQFYSVSVNLVAPSVALQPGTAAIAAMAALGTGVLGAPLSMICLALEVTGDFSVTVGAIVASSVAALIVRETFGYSFATWRFHLRGEVIRGPQDIGWIKQWTATMLMRSDFEIASATMSVCEAQKLFPPGTTKQIVVQEQSGRYGGIVSAADLHSTNGLSDRPIHEMATQKDVVLYPEMTIRNIMAEFERTETDIIVVVDDPINPIAIGTITEAHVLRTYGEELERRNQEMYSR